jgi:general L-amino acid transport system substrate-binding protein
MFGFMPSGRSMTSFVARLLALLFLCFALDARADTISAMKASRHFDCGAIQNIDDWSAENIHGDLSGLATEICRAVAVAIFGDASGLAVREFPGELEAVDALTSGKIQLAVGVSPSAAVAMKFGLAYARPIFFDSQRFLVARQSGVADLAGLRDKVICALDMTPPERTLRDEMTAREIPYALVAHSEQGEMDAAVAVGRCAGTALESRLAQSRAAFHARVSDFVFLPERLSLAPIAPAYLAKDADFGLLVDWTISALIEAEALGITQANVADALKRADMRAEQLLGGDFATAQAFGLAHDWAAKVVATTGNYGEIFRRTVGEPYRLDRGLNALWTQGGLMTPAPMK